MSEPAGPTLTLDGLTVARGHQFFLDLGALGRIHGGLVARRRQLIHRQIGTGILGTRIG